MNTILIFLWVIIAFIFMSFLEKTIEGPNAWGKKSYGWKIKLTRRLSMTEYHLFFWLFIIMLASLPLVVYGFSLKLLGVLISAFIIGLIVEDFLYFIVNPFFGLRKFNSKDANWYPWIKLGKFEIPAGYMIGIAIALLSWYFLWR